MVNFDHISFIATLMKEAYEIIPAQVSQERKEFILNSIYDCCNLVFDKISNDKKNIFNENQIQFIMQLVGEWTFHKALDLVTAEIDSDISTKVLLRISCAIYKIACDLYQKDKDEDDIIEPVENKVKEVFVSALEEFQKEGSLTSDALFKAISQSNVKKMRQAGFREKNKSKLSLLGLIR